MSGIERNIQALFRWDGNDFVLVPIQKNMADDESQTFLFIDESTRTIIFRMGNDVGLIDKRIISRRFQGISKTGISVEGISLGISYHVIEHVGNLNLWELIKDASSGLTKLTDTGISIKKTEAKTRTRENEPRATSRPLPARQKVDASSPLTGYDNEALKLGLKILKHIENGRMVIVDTDKNVTAYTKFV